MSGLGLAGVAIGSLPIDWDDLGKCLLAMAVAYLLALPIALDRERNARSAGLRTFPIVAIASAGYVLLARAVMTDSAEAQARILEGLITGIGFIGGGAILKEGATVHGTATAASIWTTGAIGAAAAYGHHEIAIVLSAMNFVTLRVMQPLKRGMRRDESKPPDDKA